MFLRSYRELAKRQLRQQSRSRFNSLGTPHRFFANRSYQWSHRIHGTTVLGGVAITAGLSVWYSLFQSGSERKLDKVKFVPTTVQAVETHGPDSKLIRIRLPPEYIPENARDALRPIWALNFKNSDIQVERAYTPLEGITKDGEMKFWIKKYEHGEMGRWLHERQHGETLEVRGPERSWNGNLDEYDRIVMIAGGTGVAPFYQLLHTIFTDESRKHNANSPRFILLHSHRNLQVLPPGFVMENLSRWAAKNPDVLDVKTFVEAHEGSEHRNTHQGGRITREVLLQALQQGGKSDFSRTLVLICGPESMVTAFAGPRGRDFSQGPVGGVLASLGLTERNIWKL